MTPYSSPTYFGVIAVLLLPMIAAALRGRVTWHWTMLCTALMLLVQYALPLHGTLHDALIETSSLVAFGLLQVLLLLLVLRRTTPRGTALWSVTLGALPLVIVKLGSTYVQGWAVGFNGISYVTFRALDVLWCISDGALKQVGVLDYLIYLFFFPTISSGPIDRFKRFHAGWRRERNASEFWNDLDAGVGWIFRGLLYKFIFATTIDRYILGHAAAVPGLPGVFQYGLVWGLYLFFDFAGYSAFAVGVSRCFGVRATENFASPFAATSIRDFWTRWHISLSTWFRDHLYMRFLLMARKKKWFARPETASMAAYFVSFGTMGLWHGLTSYYIAYGLYHATLLTLCERFSTWRKAHPDRLAGRWWKLTSHTLTMISVIFGFWMFSGHGWVQKGQGSARFFSGKFFGNHHRHVEMPED